MSVGVPVVVIGYSCDADSVTATDPVLVHVDVLAAATSLPVS